MDRKYLIPSAMVCGLLAISGLLTTPAFAQTPGLEAVWVEANCQGYNSVDVLTDGLTAGQNYSVTWNLAVTCNGNSTPTTTAQGTYMFTMPSGYPGTPYDIPVASTNGGIAWTNTIAGAGNCVVTGTATLYNSSGVAISTVPIFVNNSEPGQAELSCPAAPAACVLPPSGTAIPGSPVSWNGFTAPAGSVVWINAHLDAKNVPNNTITTVDFTGVTLQVNTTAYSLPNGQVVFNPAVQTPSTVVNADGSWTTTVNSNFNNDIFFVGGAIPVDLNMENGGNGNTNSTLSFSTNSSDSTFQFQWQWGAAVYTSWPGNAAADIEPVHAQQQAGAPLNLAVEADLIQGPRGGGGSNFTGSWSGTGQGNCP
jgi:hypothetical protein